MSAESDQPRQLRRAIVAATIGTTIEWYDFFLYSTITGLVFGKLFFPESEPLVGTLQAFLIYASEPPSSVISVIASVASPHLLRHSC